MTARRIDRYRLELPATGRMKTRALVYLHERMAAEDEALDQLRDAASVDARSIVIGTPDIHTGFGVPIGSVVASPELVSPAAVGYDVNCGMRLLTAPFGAAEVSPALLAEAIRDELPLGEGKGSPLFALNERQLLAVLDDGVPGLLRVARADRELAGRLDPEQIDRDLRRIEDRGAVDADAARVSQKALERGLAQLGTLGGGNHFVEIQRVERVERADAARALGLAEGQAVVMIHSGSRGLGHQVADEHMKAALGAAERFGLTVPNRQLAFVPAESEEGRAFLGAMGAAANFAFANRQAIAAIVRRAFARAFGRPVPMPLVYDVSHNIARRERPAGERLYVHRKGATRALPASRMRGTDLEALGQPVLIPGSMGTASYVLLGAEGAAESLFSVNHGAGRVMSRTAAAGRRRGRGRGAGGRISEARFEETMRGVHLVCEDRWAAREEAPDAYKDVDLVVETVVGAGLAEVVARLVPLAVLKG
jgi:tRNA-splicing ligase RtcB (3'-phosphate/5'-hydroxy nucleic acid ligase)